jgi:hypothetical protein
LASTAGRAFGPLRGSQNHTVKSESLITPACNIGNAGGYCSRVSLVGLEGGWVIGQVLRAIGGFLTISFQ